MKTIITIALLSMAAEAFADDVAFAARYRSFANTGGNEIYLGLPDLGKPENRLEIPYNWTGLNSFRFGLGEYSIGGIFALWGWTEIDNEALATRTLINQQALREADRIRIIIWNREPDGYLSVPHLEIRRGINVQTLPPFIPPAGTVQSYEFRAAGFCPGRDIDWSLDGLLQQDGTFSNSQELSKVEILMESSGIWPNNPCSDTVFRDGFED